MLDKEYATLRLGGTEEQAARWIGITPAVYRQWPDTLHPVMTDRVYAAILRRETAKALGMSTKQFFADLRGEAMVEALLSRLSQAVILQALAPQTTTSTSAR